MSHSISPLHPTRFSVRFFVRWMILLLVATIAIDASAQSQRRKKKRSWKEKVEYADSIKADLEGRAKVEATNIADRQIDIAWLTEGERIQAKLRAFKSNIGSLNGKTCSEEITAWEDLGKMYDFAIKTTKKAYMPNSERQKQYLAIYDEITTTNDNLLLRIRYLATKRQADNIVAAMTQFHHRVSENATASYNRWRNSANDAGTVKHKTNR